MQANESFREQSARRLTDINRAITSARSIEELLELAIGCAVELLRAECAVLMMNDDEGLLRIRAAHGVSPAAVEQFREPLDENLLTRLSGVMGAGATDRFLGVPLIAHGLVTGLLAVKLPEGRLPDEESEWLLSSLADQTAVAFENTRSDDVRLLLEQRVDQLVREQEGKNRAIEILSHDLRTPLSALLGYTALMSSEIVGPVTERQQTVLQRMKGVCDHMESVLTNVLEMARLTGGRFALSSELCDLSDVIASAIDVVRPAAERAGIRVVQGGMSTPAFRCDTARLRLVLVQLLDNAVKYSPEGCPVTVVRQTIQRPEGDFAQIDVIDEGPGIEKDRQDQIFQPYVRRDGNSDRAKSGVGLGLAIARGIIERLGGTLSLTSTPGRGATFRILIPIPPSDRVTSQATA